VRSHEPKSVEEWVRTAQVFQDLVTLAMDAPSAALKEALLPSDELRDGGDSSARDEVALYAQHVAVGDPDAPGARGGDALFTLAVEGVDFGTVVPRWFEVREQFRIACDMILSLIYVPGGYIQTQLITAVAAAEAIHEALKLDPPVPNPEFKALKKSLVDSVPANRRQWLREKLGRNTHTLRQRLMDLATLPDGQVMQMLLPNPEGWADAATKSRNLVAHGGQSSSDVHLMSAITEVTITIVIVSLLHQLGIPTERVMYALTTSSRFERAARLARAQWPAVSS
jgi:hypothetical protein